MPYPSEHVARLRDPKGYKTFRRQNDKGGEGVDFIFGITEDGTAELQAVRFDRERFTPEQVREWLKNHDMKALMVEPAKGKRPAALVENRGPLFALDHVTTNLSAQARPRYEELDGRRYLVVPMVMLTEGVHQGSHGPLYYPPEELAKYPGVWNTKPIVVYHPQVGGMGVSACSPDILSSCAVGMVLGTRYEDGKLKAEAWLDDDKIDRVDPRIREFVQNGRMMEISTGLFTDKQPQTGEWRGKPYQFIARNFRPDHLALLPDQVGACSIKDGAGLLRNSRHDDEGDQGGLAANAASFGQIKDALCAALKGRFGPQVYVEDIYPSSVVFCRCMDYGPMPPSTESKAPEFYRLGYSADRKGAVTLANDAPEEVLRVTEYKTKAGEYVANGYVPVREAWGWEPVGSRLNKLLATAGAERDIRLPNAYFDASLGQWITLPVTNKFGSYGAQKAFFAKLSAGKIKGGKGKGGPQGATPVGGAGANSGKTGVGGQAGANKTGGVTDAKKKFDAATLSDTPPTKLSQMAHEVSKVANKTNTTAAHSEAAEAHNSLAFKQGISQPARGRHIDLAKRHQQLSAFYKKNEQKTKASGPAQGGVVGGGIAPAPGSPRQTKTDISEAAIDKGGIASRRPLGRTTVKPGGAAAATPNASQLAAKTGGSLASAGQVRSSAKRGNATPIRAGRVTENQFRFPETALVTNAAAGSPTPGVSPMPMTKRNMADRLILNASTAWDEEDREFLESLNPHHLEKLVVNAADEGFGDGDDDDDGDDGGEVEENPATEGNTDSSPDDPNLPGGPLQPDGHTPGKNKDNDMVKDASAEGTTQNAEQYIANAPEGIREVLATGYRAYQQQKKGLVDQIVANRNNRFTRAFLEAQQLDMLSGLAALAEQPKPAGAARPAPTTNSAPPMFIGAAAPPPVTNSAKQTPLLPPKMEFDSVH